MLWLHDKLIFSHNEANRGAGLRHIAEAGPTAVIWECTSGRRSNEESVMQSEPTIFIVDDEKAVRESVAALLRAHKLRVELFGSAEEFLSACDGASSGCLIADMRLEGGMNGVQLQQALVERGGKLPVIMITGHVDEKAAKDAVANGALCVLQKPVPYKELLGHVRRALDIDADRRKV